MSANESNNVPPPQPVNVHHRVIVPDNPIIIMPAAAAAAAGVDGDNDQPNGGIQEIEDELTPLQLLIENQEWETALVRMRAHPDEILPSSKTHNGRALTALHLACESGECPFPLIVGILQRKPQAIAMVDKDGNLPLHNACAGHFAYDPLIIAILLAGYPQAVFMQEKVDQNTPLHLLLLLGGDVNPTSLQLLLDVAYSTPAGLAKEYIPMKDFAQGDLTTSLLVASAFPPIMIQTFRQLAIEKPLGFPKFLHAFLHLPAPTTLRVPARMMEGQPKLLLMQESKLQTPLHTACSRGVSTEVVKLLCDDERYPGAHEASRIRERKDRYPLFYAGCYGIPPDGIKLLFDLNPSAIHHWDTYRILSVHIAYISPRFQPRDRKLEMIGTRDDPEESIDSYFVRDTGPELWRMYDLLLRLTYHDSYEDPPPGCCCWRVLHASVSVPSPPQIIRTAIRLNPWQVKEADEDGMLPIHLAAKCERPQGIDELQYWLAKGVNRGPIHFRLIEQDLARDHPIVILTEAYPCGAKKLDNTYRLPLHYAASTGKPVGLLIKAAPLALATPDGVERLYPFLLAAAGGHVNETFELLVANPMMVHGALSTDVEGGSEKVCCSRTSNEEKKKKKRFG